jgi:hypothetical protein
MHTLCDNAPLSHWFDELPLWIQMETQNVFCSYLVACLKSKNTGLIGDPNIASIVHAQENGYLA